MKYWQTAAMKGRVSNLQKRCAKRTGIRLQQSRAAVTLATLGRKIYLRIFTRNKATIILMSSALNTI